MDEAWANGLFAENFDDVWRFARRRTDSAAEADDVTADVFAVAWRRRADVPVDTARLWLFGVARHVLANSRREASRRTRLHLRIAATNPRPESYDPEHAGDEPLWPALAALGEDDRDLLLMRAWDGLSVADIAVLLRCSAPTVSSRLHRAHRRLAAELARRDPEAPGHVRADPTHERSAS